MTGTGHCADERWDHTLDHLLTHRTRRNKELATREKKTASRIVTGCRNMYIIDVLAERVGIFRSSSENRVFPGNLGSSTQRNGMRCVEHLGMILSNIWYPGNPARFAWTTVCRGLAPRPRL